MIPSVAPLGLMQAPDVIERVYGTKVQLGHGGEPMGSIMMYLRPDRVQMSRAGEWGRRDVLGCPVEGLGTLRVGAVRVAVALDMEDVTPPTGSMSDPSLASADRGRQLVDYAVGACAGFLRWFRGVDPHFGTGRRRAGDP
jgi:creatinine amidohydrolase